MRRMTPRNAQRGIVLAVVMILLVVMTLLALASLGGALLEERMGTAQLDRNLSLQAAEAALREAEEVVRGKPAMPAVGDPCNAGLCATPDMDEPDQQQRWLNAGFWDDDSGNWAEAAVDVGDLTARPRYIIELMDAEVPDPESCITGGDVSLESACTMLSSRYRITVRSAAEGRAAVMLQSIYAVP